MMRKVLLGFVFLGCFLPIRAQWQKSFDVSCFHFRGKGWNTLLALNLNPVLWHIEEGSGNLVAKVDVRISFRPSQSSANIREHSFRQTLVQDFFSTQNAFFREYRYQLPPGQYSILVEIRDAFSGQMRMTELSYECRSEREPYGQSDIGLFQIMAGGALVQPVLNEAIGPSADSIRYVSEIYSAGEAPVSLKAVLFKAEGYGSGRSFGMGVSSYASVEQQVKVVFPKEGKAHIQGAFYLKGFGEGDYLLEIYQIQDGKILSEESRRFRVDAPELSHIFLDMDTSLLQMEVLAGAEWVSETRGLEPGPKEERFWKFWEGRKLPEEEDGKPAMVRWFARVYESEKLFGEGEKPGWATDRGRNYCLFGTPTQRAPIDWNGKKWEVWTYSHWNFRLIFEQQGDGFVRFIR